MSGPGNPEQARADQLQSLMAAKDAMLQELSSGHERNQELLTRAASMHAEMQDALAQADERTQRAHALITQMSGVIEAGGLDATAVQPAVKTGWFTRTKNNVSEKASKTVEAVKGRKLTAGIAAAAILVGGLTAGSTVGNAGDHESQATGTTAPEVAPGTTATTPPTTTNPFESPFSDPTTTTQTETTTPPATDATKASKNDRSKVYAYAEKAKSVTGTVKRLNPNDRTVKEDINYLGSAKHKADKLDNETSRGAVNSVLMFDEYGGGKLNENDYAVAAADAAFSNEANGSKFYNIMNKNYQSDVLPQGVSLDEARQEIRKQLTADGTKFDVETPLGTFMNHGATENDVFESGLVTLNGREKVFTITFEDGYKMYFKLFKGQGGEDCINFLTPRVVVKLPAPRVETPPASNPHPTPNVVTPPATPGTPGTGTKTPGTKTPTTTTETEKIPDQKKSTDKDTPAGVPGKAKGQGGDGQETKRPEAGTAKPGVGEPQLAKPDKVVPANGESTPTVPAVTGQEPIITGPAEQGDPAAESPAGQVNPNNKPAGD